MTYLLFFLTSRFQVLQGMFVQSFAQKYSKNCLRRTNIESNLTPEIECTLKPSNYDAKP